MSDEFEILESEYMKAHPKAVSPFDHLVEFGHDALVRIMKEAKGRKIVFERDPTSDERDLDRSHIVVYE